MRRLAILAAALAAPLALIMAAAPALAAEYAWPVVRVIDGDTIVVDASADLPPAIAEVRIRLRGIDAPETGHRAACEAEREAAGRATAFVERRLGAAGTVTVRDLEWGKWGGRIVADVMLDGGTSLADLVGQFGHARRDLDPDAARGWCGGVAAPADDPVARLVDRWLAEGDARKADDAGRTDYRAEVMQHILDPCLAGALHAGHVDHPRLNGLGERAAVAEIKSIAAAQIATIMPGMTRLVAGRPAAVRDRFYDGMLALCLDEFAGTRH